MATTEQSERNSAMDDLANGTTANNEARNGRNGAAKKRRMRRALLVVALAVIAGGVWAYFHYRYRVSTDDAQVDGHLVSIAPRISGTVLQILIHDNEHIVAGQELVRIDPRDFQARVDQARAALKQAESQVGAASVTVPLTQETTQTGTSAAEAQLADAEAEYQRAKAAYEQANGADLAFAQANIKAKQAANDRAQADLERMEPLVKKQEISRLQYDGFLAAARVAASELQAAQEKLASATKEAEIRQAAMAAAASRVSQARAQLRQSIAGHKQVAIRAADLKSATARVAQAKADLELAELQLSYTNIVAPVEGVVTNKTVQIGQIVQPAEQMFTLIPLHQTWVTANFKETQLADIRPGQHAEISVDMYDKTITGHVDSIAGATGARLSLLPPENATGNFVKVVQRIPVKILVDQTPGIILRPGMSVEATILTH
jgi:membrane fusion protein (multidrug efflux system)